MIDEKKIEAGIRLLLEGIGEDLERPGLKDTPHRIANMYKEIYGGLGADASVHLGKTFPAINNELVLEKDITFYSTCEHHLLPFYGKAHIAYIPDDKVVGLSKLGPDCGCVCQTASDSGTDDSSDRGCDYGTPETKGRYGHFAGGAYVHDNAGIKKPGSQTMTYICRGAFENNPELQQMVFQMVKS